MRDPLGFLVAAASTLTATALGATGEVSPLLLFVGPWAAATAALRTPGEPLAPRTEVLFRIAFVGFLAHFLWCVLTGRLLAGAVALTLPVQVYYLLDVRSPVSVRRLAMLSFFQLVALAAATTSILFVPILVPWLVLAAPMLTLLQLETALGMPRRPLPLAPGLVRAAGWPVAACLLLGAIGFVVWPRHRELGVGRGFAAGDARVSGFSDRVRLGDIGRIKLDRRVVLRVRLAGDAPADMRWRGVALDRFTGHAWISTARGRRELARPVARLGDTDERGGHTVVQEIALEPMRSRAVFHLASPVEIAAGDLEAVWADDAGNLQSVMPVTERSRYRVVSRSRAGGAGTLDGDDRQRYLQLPPLDPRVAELGARVSEPAGDDLGRARRIEAHLTRRHAYSLDVDDRGVRDPVARFLLEERPGHCEYFATGMAVLLRTRGIPARVVNGFQRGTYSWLLDAWVVRQSDAHSWVEAWIPGRGWVSFDPTPAEPEAEAPGLLGSALDAVTQLLVFWDDSVIGFSRTYQQGLWITLGEAAAAVSRRVRSLPAVTAGVASGVALLVALASLAVVVVFRRRGDRRRRAPRYLESARRLVARRGHVARQGATAREWAEGVTAWRPEVGEVAQRLVRHYYAARFGRRRPAPAACEALVRELRARLRAAAPDR
jgi:transglutaminase-like putative cysteine protease